jgi:hypothetical protein
VNGNFRKIPEINSFDVLRSWLYTVRGSNEIQKNSPIQLKDRV